MKYLRYYKLYENKNGYYFGEKRSLPLVGCIFKHKWTESAELFSTVKTSIVEVTDVIDEEGSDYYPLMLVKEFFRTVEDRRGNISGWQPFDFTDRLFQKKIKKGNDYYPLTDEEREMVTFYKERNKFGI